VLPPMRPSLSMMRRREFLASSARLAGAAALSGSFLTSWAASLAAQGTSVPARERMIVHSLRYLTLELPMSELNAWTTPTELFFVRNNLLMPTVDLDAWRLRVMGEVERPFELTFAELQKLRTTSVTNTIECAGNGRRFFAPRIPGGVQWGRGAVSNAEFAGPPLADVLRRAGVKASGKHVAFNGLDELPGPDFIRSIPIEKAMHAGTLLATHMNGEPLTLEHGFPVRALVPGWIGAASIKWLTEIRVLDKEFEGFFMNPGYRLPKHPVQPGAIVKPEDTAAVTSLAVKSVIAQPGEGTRAKLGPIRISGAAWAGEAEIARVDLSTDDGRTWQPTTLGRDKARYAWRLFEHTWTPPKPGDYTILSRATDRTGRTQPKQMPWNAEGYLYNAMDRVRIHVEA
jgi:sulfite oxidase